MAAHKVHFHAATWWIWAMCAALLISVTSSLLLVGVSVALAISISKVLITEDKSWKTFKVMVNVAFFILISRIVLQIAFGVPVGSQILFRLPEVHLPDWFSGLRIGGIVTFESLLASLNDSLRLSGLIVVIAAAVSLTTTSRVIQQLPIAFHEIGMVIIIAFTFLPHLFEDVHRIKQASRWRGQKNRGIRNISHNLVNVSESALERSVRLAAALTVRGYGNATANNSWRKPIYLGLSALTITIIRVLVSTPTYLDAILMVAACTLIIIGIRKANLLTTRTKFRTETWTPQDVTVISLAVFALLAALINFNVIAILISILIFGFTLNSSRPKVLSHA